tara:strand:+ start:387 stop:557 length:171 start_codon:yes stop_codon:yes gene_type:complete
MKKVLISFVLLFCFGTGFYLLNNSLNTEDNKTIDCPCTPDCQPGDAWCSCKESCGN